MTDRPRSGMLVPVARRASTARRRLTALLARPASALALLGVVGIGTATAAAGLVLVRGGVTPTARPFLALWIPLGIGAAALVGAIALRVGARGRVGTDSTVGYPVILRAVVAALLVVVPLALVPLALFLWRTTDSSETLFFGLLDKRYVVSAYYVVVLGVPISLLVGARATAATRADPTKDPYTTPGARQGVAAPWRRLRPVIALIAAAVTASYFYGPPWGARPLGGPIDYHETVHFTGLQAIHTGALPYVGAGADQYGPGSQLFVFGWMKLVGGFSVAGFREAYAAQHWLAIAFVCALVLLFLPTRAAVIALALAILVFPTFRFFGFDANGYGLDSFFGWGNVWRYSGLLLLGLALPRVLAAHGRTARWSLVALGAVWGVTCLLAQESLFGGILVVLAVVLALVLSGSIKRADLGRSLLALGAGSAAVAVPVLAIYLGLGQVGPFLRNYLLVPLAVSGGYSNTPWWQDTPWHTTYILLPLLTLACGLIAVLRLRPLTIAGRWSQNRAVLFGCFVAASVAQAGAFLRADTSHLFNVMLVTPILVGATAALGGPLLGLRSAISRSLLGLCVVAAGWALLPWDNSSLAVARSRLGDPWSARTAQYDQQDAVRQLRGVGARRLGPGYEALLRCCSASNISVTEFVHFANDLRRVVGGRRTYVSTSAPEGQPGLWYFVADLQPFDLPFEPTSMAFDRAHLSENLRALADRGRPLGAVVTTNPGSEDSRIAIKRLGPNPEIHRLPYGDSTVQVFVASR